MPSFSRPMERPVGAQPGARGRRPGEACSQASMPRLCVWRGSAQGFSCTELLRIVGEVGIVNVSFGVGPMQSHMLGEMAADYAIEHGCSACRGHVIAPGLCGQDWVVAARADWVVAARVAACASGAMVSRRARDRRIVGIQACNATRSILL